MTFDGKAFGAEIVGIVKGHVERSLAPIMARLESMEKAIGALPAPKDGEPGTSVTIDDVAPMIRAEAERVGAGVLAAAKATVAELVANLPPGPAGKDADPEIIKQMVDAAIAALPPAEKGKDADPVEVAAQIAAEVERAVAALPPPRDGNRATVEDMRPLVEESVSRAIAGIAMPKDGTNGLPGRDGIGLAGALIDRTGNLVLTLTDGTVRELGLVVGKDGESGKPGVDGLGFEEMTEELADDGRTIVRRYSRGDQVKEFRHSLAVVLDRGVFKEGQSYRPGDGVTWAGSFWIAQAQTSEKPDGGEGWRLAVKRGRDGKDGVLKDERPKEPVRIGVPARGQ
ncbi:hypothetical protein FJ422_30410 [Mesorhizobium sp. B2-6-3]|uniref:hypothetical protein n=1 Tax=Mesorhizobium sp. B2-6-3 TaxID=2589914 RepID=UPI001129C75B|nr:hypothetical protein [Mesorhizobium sp. B2-6-3]TPJ76198.1 hypothetical protein FJ422_30410 [Mesorhizobium sp. B2-6-3]